MSPLALRLQAILDHDHDHDLRPRVPILRWTPVPQARNAYDPRTASVAARLFLWPEHLPYQNSKHVSDLKIKVFKIAGSPGRAEIHRWGTSLVSDRYRTRCSSTAPSRPHMGMSGIGNYVTFRARAGNAQWVLGGTGQTKRWYIEQAAPSDIIMRRFDLRPYQIPPREPYKRLD